MTRSPSPRRASRAFTLIELILVLIVMGILVAVLAFGASSVETAVGVRTGWLTLAEAQLAAHDAAASNGPGYLLPAWQSGPGCVSQTTGGVDQPTAPSLTFLYSCTSTAPSVVSVVRASAGATLYLAVAQTATTCLVMVDQITGPDGSATTYGEDTATPTGHCSAAYVSDVATSVTSTSTEAPTSLNGLL